MGLAASYAAVVVGTETGEQARKHIDELSRKYVGSDYRNPIGPQGLVILQIAADKVNTPATVRRRCPRTLRRPVPARPPRRPLR